MTTRLSVEVSRYKLAAMLHVYMVVCGALILAIGSGVNSYWDEIVKLAPSAAAFLGALAGAGGGLLAIILGALINAELNRLRDDRLRQKETASLMKALASEMEVISKTSRALGTVLSSGFTKGIKPSSMLMFDPPRATIFEANADKIGWIPDRPQGEIFRAINARETISSGIRTATNSAGGSFSAAFCKQLGKNYESLAEAAGDAEEALREAL